jgi:hypothetical protein
LPARIGYTENTRRKEEPMSMFIGNSGWGAWGIDPQKQSRTVRNVEANAS